MLPIDLDIDMLRCFVAVAQSGSFTKAGKQVGLTQSGVSVKIRRLEERLEKQIFDRSGKRLSLTPEGELLLDYSRRILSVHEEAVSRLTRPRARGNLRVGIIDYFIPGHLPALLSKFTSEYPNIHLTMHTGFSTDMVPLFEKGELDLVVAGKENFVNHSRPLTREPLIWVVAEDMTAIPDDAPVPLALLPPPCSLRKLATEGLEKANRKWEILFTGASISNIQAAVQAGIGISILPQGALRDGLKKAPAQLGLPELPMYSIVVITDEQKKHEARDVFISYLEAALDKEL